MGTRHEEVVCYCEHCECGNETYFNQKFMEPFNGVCGECIEDCYDEEE